MSQPPPMKCKAHNRQGNRCGRKPMVGQLVCDMHGGKEPHALANAERRMRDLVYPAIASIQRQIDKDEFPAAKYVLDWAGFKPTPDDTSQVELPPISVTVSFDRVDEAPIILSLPPHAQNGSTST